ncbi:uncharacterized protein LOC144148567 [Haemaphysalis longicornis]
MRLILANGLFWGNVVVSCLAAGVFALGVSFRVRWDHHILALMPGRHLSMVAYFLLGCGGVLLVAAAFGVFIAWRLRKRDKDDVSAENGARGCAVYNAMAVAVILYTSLSSCLVYAYVVRAKAGVDEDLRYAMYQYFVDASSRDKLDSLHREFKCCGINNHTDWVMATAGAVLEGAGGIGRAKNRKGRTFVPRTCCVVESSGGTCLKYHEQGCRDVLLDYLNMLLPSIVFCVICVVVWLLSLMLTSHRLRKFLLENPNL